MRRRRVVAVALAGAVAWGTAFSPAMAVAHQAAARQAPADVVYTFNTIKRGGVVRDVTGPTHRQLRLSGHWKRAVGANGQKEAVRMMARSQGVISRSHDLTPHRRAIAVALTVRVRGFVGSDTPNLAQQGFFRDAGQWKMEAVPDSGRIRCRFKGVSGISQITSRRGINDGQFHLVACYRIHGRVGVQIDGRGRSIRSNVGSIVSSRQVTLGNKNLKSADDQFRGTVDYFSIALGRHPLARAIAAAPKIP
ncbi:MAG: LamG-like jellyroll fold domain-containing protein [Actinomycetes bacterium]